MTKKCEHCENSFEAVRATAKYCSERCKKAGYRLSGTSDTGLAGQNSELAGQRLIGTCVKIASPMDCYECQREDRERVKEGKDPQGCSHQWYEGFDPHKPGYGAHVESYHENMCTSEV